MDVVLVGHRGTGKTTLGQELQRQFGWAWIDLDDYIEAREETSCEAIIADSEERFRELERASLDELLADPSDPSQPRIITVGGGFGPLPRGPVYVWLRRDGWWETAASQREQVWPELSLSEEFARMRTEREPRWAASAQILHDIPRGRTIERSGRDLGTRISWLHELKSGWGTTRSWLVPASSDIWQRAIEEARRFEFAGVEMRSDLFETPCQQPGEVRVLASLRTPDTSWLPEWAHFYDVDIDFLPRLLESNVLGERQPRPLVLSAHPEAVDSKDVEALVSAARRLAERFPEWAPEVQLKYAPQVSSPFDAGAGMAMLRPVKKRGYQVTYLPQGRTYAWLRPILLQLGNMLNYVAVGLSEEKVDGGTPGVGAAWDLDDWLGHLVGPPPARFDVLIGSSVEKSQGDLWHRRAALEAGEPFDYLKVSASESDLEAMLVFFQGVGVRGVSVTSPHKEAVLECEGVVAPGDLDAVNTMRRADFGWAATDTDTVGMVGALRAIEDAGVQPGKIAVIGTGGVSDAVVRGIHASAGWRLVEHARARDGWPEEAEPVRLVVNAAGHYGSTAEGPPDAEAWLDLHYTDVAPPPGDYRHFIGDDFFDAQAAAQRNFWNDR